MFWVCEFRDRGIVAKAVAAMNGRLMGGTWNEDICKSCSIWLVEQVRKSPKKSRVSQI